MRIKSGIGLTRAIKCFDAISKNSMLLLFGQKYRIFEN